jgi:hypothetical protein
MSFITASFDYIRRLSAKIEKLEGFVRLEELLSTWQVDSTTRIIKRYPTARFKQVERNKANCVRVGKNTLFWLHYHAGMFKTERPYLK